MFHDLLRLRYAWGHSPEDGSGLTDCFGLACTVRQRLGLSDYGPRFRWVYTRYDEATLPRGRILRWVLENADPCSPRPGAISVVQTTHGALLTHTEHGVICIGPGQNVIHAPVLPDTLRTYWLRE
jgi:hypothetical protein